MTPLKQIDQLRAEGWRPEQIQAQRNALRGDLDISYLDSREWSEGQMDEQCWALSEELDLVGIDQGLDWAERAPKRADGRRFLGLDPSQWRDSQMTEQTQALRGGVDLSGLDAASLTLGHMHEQRLSLLVGLDLFKLADTNANWTKVSAQREAFRRGSALAIGLAALPRSRR